VISICGNVVSNVIMGAANTHPIVAPEERPRVAASNAGALTAILTHLIQVHVEQMVERVYGEDAVEASTSRADHLARVTHGEGHGNLVEVEK
jgi:hypothetical protein